MRVDVMRVMCVMDVMCVMCAMDYNGGLLVNRGDFRRCFKEQLLSGGQKDCIADACAMLLGAEPCDVSAFFGNDRSLNRACALSSSARLTDLT